MHITQSELKKILKYSPNTGIFTWRESPSRSVKKQSIAGTIESDGYSRICIKGIRTMAHRLAWLYAYGYLPENEIDHIDRNPINNKIRNLREVSKMCNQRNTSLQKNNTSGIKGVSFSKNESKWRTRIIVAHKTIHLGSYRKLEDAAKARWKAEKEHGFPNCCTDSSAYLYLKEHNII